MAGAVAIYVASMLLHQFIYATWHLEEPVFFLIAVFVAPVMFMVGVAGSIVHFVHWVAKEPKT